MALLPHNIIQEYQQNGAVLLKNMFSDWVDILQKGVAYNMQHPSEYAAENVKEGEGGRFFDDYCNWQRITAFEQFIKKSAIAEIAGALMQSSKVQLFHDHVLVKEPGTSKETPWHQDSPYYFCDGEQTVSFWLPLDVVNDASLRCIKGSHKWPKPVLPVRWLNEDSFYAKADEYIPVPDPDNDKTQQYDILSWPMEPGDAVAFHYKTVHGAKGNISAARRRAFSVRFVGDDVRYITRAGRTSPPFPGHNMQDGDCLRDDWFPILR